jgi:hypothetical protein
MESGKPARQLLGVSEGWTPLAAHRLMGPCRRARGRLHLCGQVTRRKRGRKGGEVKGRGTLQQPVGERDRRDRGCACAHL